jgi:Cu/Ag efflux protein CusF
MKLARILGSLVLGGVMLTGHAAFAQQAQTGLINTINRIDGTVAIEVMPSGTVGASGGAIQQFNVKDMNLLEKVHAGDRVSFSVTDTAGTKTVTQLDRQK